MPVYKATILNPVSADDMQVFDPGYLRVNENGIIEELSENPPARDEPVEDYSDFLLTPGFIDLHTHLPQYAFVGLGDMPLLPWLNTYTFPQELKLADDDIAQKQAAIFFKDLKRLGTTTVVAYITAHSSATDIAFAEAEKAGIRAYLGKVLMNRNAPTGLLEETEPAIKGCIDLIDKWHNKGKLQFIVSPRFAISCSEDMLQEAGRLSGEYNLFLQSHLSENEDEIQSVLDMFRGIGSYTEVYDKYGCLNARTFMGHGIHLSKDELSLVKEKEAAIIHCPTSNRFLSSGIMPARKYIDQQVKVGLGTDVAAGYSLSMMHESREALEMSKLLPARPLNVVEVFHLATLRAAQLLQADQKIGSLEKGKEADFILIDDRMTYPFQDDSYQQPLERLSRIFYRTHSMKVRKTFVAGKLVYEQ